ncbi:MAG: prepilin-type N-terminal cleavage/methylation domain-containing protein [Deltaproteobacteria bacterium]|nr:prepilin-type N-terminal cleavage/methylation domain-containing protein [Deltaproteobacteria bacterium]
MHAARMAHRPVRVVREPRRRSQRGFTLIELLVATAAGMFVVLAAFMLSRGATRIFASEGRVANSQLSLRLGVERLRQDIERAAFMTSPNVKIDPDVCPDPNTLGYVTRLQSIRWEQGTAATSAATTPASADNLLNPDRLMLTGNFSTTDSYLAATIEPSSSGAGWDVVLQSGFASTARLLSGGDGGTSTAAEALATVFPAGRMIRVRNDLGSSQYLIVQSSAIGAGGRVIITIGAMPSYTVVDGASVVKRCGARGLCLGCEVNPVQFVRYEVRSLATSAAFKWAYPSSATVGDREKYDLVRTELQPDGVTPILNSEEIVSEFAVDLGFAFAVDTSPSMVGGSAWLEPTLQSLPFGHADNARYAGDVLTDPTVRPQRIRAVRYRLSTRTRFPEFPSNVDDAGPGLARYKLGTTGYARVRNVMGEVALPNQQGIRW